MDSPPCPPSPWVPGAPFDGAGSKHVTAGAAGVDCWSLPRPPRSVPHVLADVTFIRGRTAPDESLVRLTLPPRRLAVGGASKHSSEGGSSAPAFTLPLPQGLQGLCRVSTAPREDMLGSSTPRGPRCGRGQPSAGGTCEPKARWQSGEEGVTGLRGAEGPPTPSGENRAFNPHPQGRRREHPSFDGVSLVYKCKDSDQQFPKVWPRTPARS